MSESNGHNKNGKAHGNIPDTPEVVKPKKDYNVSRRKDCDKPPIFNEKGRRICGAKLRNKPGRTCQSTRVMQNGRCRIHGGATPTGPDCVNYIHGRRSKYAVYQVPARLADRYERAATDPDLLHLTKDIALIETRVQELLDKLNSGDSAANMETVRALWSQFEELANGTEKQRKKATALLPQIGDAIKSTGSDAALWSEIRETVRERVSLAKAEHDRRISSGATIPIEVAFVWVNALMDLVRQHVTEPEVRQRLIRGLLSIADSSGGVVDAAGHTQDA